MLVRVRGGVDPPNATTLFVLDPSDSGFAHAFNVTHLYTRRAFKELGVQMVNKRCQQNREEMYIRYWINSYKLPKRIIFVDARGRTRNMTDVNEVTNALENLLENKIARELELKLMRVNRETYYDLMDKLLCSPNSRFRGIIPIEIHFRSSPYSQSSFVEFVTNRDVVWELYHDDVYSRYAGNPLDLLYRFRHNFRHSLGLGHLDSQESVMFPTNVPGLANVNPLDVDAVHVLLCSEMGPIAINVNKVATASSAPSTTTFRQGIGAGMRVFVYKIENNKQGANRAKSGSLLNRTTRVYTIDPTVQN